MRCQPGSRKPRARAEIGASRALAQARLAFCMPRLAQAAGSRPTGSRNPRKRQRTRNPRKHRARCCRSKFLKCGGEMSGIWENPYHFCGIFCPA